MRLIDVDKLSPDCLTKDGKLAISQSQLANAPIVDLKDIYQEGHYDGHLEGYTKAINEERLQGEWKNVGFMVCECNNCKNQFHELEANNYCPNCGARMRDGADCMDEDAKQASIPYTYNAPQHDWKCGYPDITRDKGGAE